MIVLKIIGWVFVPYIMLGFQWKKLGGVGKGVGSAWAAISLFGLISGYNANNHKVEVVTSSSSIQKSTPEKTTDTKEVPKEQSSSESITKSESPKEENKPTITKTEFDKIKNGMSYEEVVKIIGGEGELLSEVGSKGEQFHTVMYMYDGEGDLGANANFTFQNNKLEMKAQMGLR